jgi:Zn-dependent protease
MDQETLRQGLILYLILVASLSVHEWAHAWTAHKLGDDTAYQQGRVTLNPASHIDPIGTVLIPLFMILFSPGFAIIGWGKPVPVNSSNFGIGRQRMKGDLLTTMAGPASNIVIAIAVAVIGGIALRFAPEGTALGELLWRAISLNLLLVVFNLIPIPPLDGSHVMRYATGMKEETFFALSRYGFFILIFLINFTPLPTVMWFAIRTLGTPLVWLMSRLAG